MITLFYFFSVMNSVMDYDLKFSNYITFSSMNGGYQFGLSAVDRGRDR